jgi:hypothetical protein
MGLFDSITGLFDSSSGGTSLDSSGNAGVLDTLTTGVGDLGSVFSSDGGGAPIPVAQPGDAMAYPVMSTMPMIARAAASGISRWAVQFPSLWQALQKYRASGVAMSIPKLWRMFKQVGPNVLAGYIGAMAVADLVTYKATHKNRRMNVANTRALGRSLRRLKGFERLSHRVSAQLSRTAHRGRRSSTRRCGVCRKSPCSC